MLEIRLILQVKFGVKISIDLSLIHFILYQIDDDDNFNTFGHPGLTLIKTFVMTTGEFDTSALKLQDKNFVVHLIFVLFVFLMSMVLLNLINALAIDDVKNIRGEGELVHFCERVEIISKYERVFLRSNGIFYDYFNKIISLFPFTLPKSKIIINDDSHEIMAFKTSITMEKEAVLDIELENLDNSKEIIDEFEKTSVKLDENVIRSIREILELRKQAKLSSNDDLESMVRKMSLNIQELMAKSNQP